MTIDCEFSLITESYNLTEGTALASFREAIRRALTEVDREGGGEVLVADVAGGDAVAAVIAEFPDARRVACDGLSYDAAKNRAAEAARGRYVVYLDGDCAPEPGWLAALMGALREGRSEAVCGYTTYRGGYWAKLQSLLDFGFLMPAEAGPAGCYPCNNWAAVRENLLKFPISVDVDLRCSCYVHAQEMIRDERPIHLVPDARVLHDLPPFFQERFRRGADLVAVCWVDPTLPEAKYLDWGWAAVPAFYSKNVRMDWRRLRRCRKELEMSQAGAALAAALIPLIRMADIVGLVRAVRETKQVLKRRQKTAY